MASIQGDLVDDLPIGVAGQSDRHGMLEGVHATAGQSSALKPRIYVETSVVSYLTARPRSLSDLGNVGCETASAVHFSPVFCPIAALWACKSGKNCPRWGRFSLSTPQVRQTPSTDAINAARQGYAQQLWLARDRYELFVSALVLDEAGDGDAEAAQRRLAALQGIPLLPLEDDTVTLAEALIRDGTMPSRAYADAMPIACAACARMDVIASWNFRHIAGLWARQRIRDALVHAGHVAPLIATPEELMESH